jgi:glycine/D-amino acid oxidase-like deaminating enzyme
MWPFRRGNAKVRSAEAYWLLRDGIGDAHASSPAGGEYDIAIVGAGITGALVADSLIRTGARIVVLDAHEVGQGSTAASTALLQYEPDAHLVDLARQLGSESAMRAYRAGIESFALLEQRFPELLGPAGYERRASLYLASGEKDVAPLRAELAARRAIGLQCDWLDEAEVRRRFGCRRPGAILSAPGAQMDPVRFTRGVLAGCSRHGVEICTRTRVESIDGAADGLRLHLSRGGVLAAKHVVVCAGYESLRFVEREIANIDNTFALVTEPLADARRAALLPLIWESARPYLYLRGTPDGRLMVGGADVPFKGVAARELLLPRQTRRIAAAYEDLFGEALPPVDFAWAGSFARTRDGLPYIGSAPGQHPRLHFALCYGGNGITYGVQAGEIVRAHVEGHGHDLDAVFGFGRLGEVSTNSHMLDETSPPN